MAQSARELCTNLMEDQALHEIASWYQRGSPSTGEEPHNSAANIAFAQAHAEGFFAALSATVDRIGQSAAK